MQLSLRKGCELFYRSAHAAGPTSYLWGLVAESKGAANHSCCQSLQNLPHDENFATIGTNSLITILATLQPSLSYNRFLYQPLSKLRLRRCRRQRFIAIGRSFALHCFQTCCQQLLVPIVAKLLLQKDVKTCSKYLECLVSPSECAANHYCCQSLQNLPRD